MSPFIPLSSLAGGGGGGSGGFFRFKEIENNL
jgi:hypothetical protein